MIAACSALEVTWYVSKERAVNLAAVLAVAHSPFAGALSHVFELGAIWRICDSVRVVDRGIKGKLRDRGRGRAVERVERVRRVVVMLLGSILRLVWLSIQMKVEMGWRVEDEMREGPISIVNQFGALNGALSVYERN